MKPFLTKSVVSTTFIGREPQLAAFEHWLTQSDGQIVLVTGEAGIGKSRFVAEAQRRAEQSGYRVLQGRCFEPDLVFPYAPLIDLLRTHLTGRPTAEMATSLGPLASELVKLLPELALALPDLKPTPALDPEAEKRRLFETLVQFFIRFGQEDDDQPPASRPLLLIIEDLHWSDDTSLEVLRYLARRLSGQPLRFLLTYRSDEGHPTLPPFLAALSREQRPSSCLCPASPRQRSALYYAPFSSKTNPFARSF